MDIKICRIVIFLLLFLAQRTILAAEIILTERKKEWDHPIIAVFKKYGISLYKVSYSRDGSCPTFYATFKYPFTSQGTNTPNFQKIYSEILKANSYFPYALVDKKNDLRINIGYENRKNIKMQVDIGKAASTSLCKDGKNHADDDADIEPFVISKQMKKLIMSSPFKTPLRRADGKNFVAYLYAEDEQSKLEKIYDCKDDLDKLATIKTGNYYLYLYDVNSDTFFPSRTQVLKEIYPIKMNIKGANFFTLKSSHKDRSDIVLLSQFKFCWGDQYEAYGFSENQLFLKKYAFIADKKNNLFYGFINQDKQNKSLIAYGDYENYSEKKMYVSVSDRPGEIKLQLAPK